MPLRERHHSPPVNGQCPTGFFLHRYSRDDDDDGGCGETGRRQRVCRRCTRCPPGSGAVRPCGRRADTVCEPCVPGTSYADLTSYDQPCLRCTPCSRYARVERNCTATHDARCHRCRRGKHRANSASYPQRDGNEYRPHCDDALWLGNKGGHGSLGM